MIRQIPEGERQGRMALDAREGPAENQSNALSAFAR